MNILIACEESQIVCKAFRERGHNAFSCDLIDPSGGYPQWHIKGDVLKLLNPFFAESDLSYGIHFITMDGVGHFIPGKWDIIIAHPPCTYMSKAGARWMFPKAGELSESRLLAAIQAKEFFLKILNADCDRIAVENPVPLKIVGLPAYTQKIQPYEYGHPYSKTTCLWLKGLPKLKPTNIVMDYTPYLPSNTSGFSRGQSGSFGVAHNSKIRSKTFEGVARAMAIQWG